MRTVLLLGVLAACLVVTYARYKSTDFTHAERMEAAVQGINEAKQSRAEKDKMILERAKTQSKKHDTSAEYLSRFFRAASQTSIKKGKARLTLEDAVKRAERILLEKKRTQMASTASIEDQAEILAEEIYHTPGSILTKDELAHIYSEIPECLDERKEVECLDIPFSDSIRTIDGTCNNLEEPIKGASFTAFQRLMPARYEDGLSQLHGFRQSKLTDNMFRDGPFTPPYPSARLVSSHIVRDRLIDDPNNLTHLVMQWGQFLDHDLDLVVELSSEEAQCDIVNCICTDVCAPIQVPDDDDAFGEAQPRAGACLPFARTIPACETEDFQARNHLNELTHYIDGSMIYGSTEERANFLREFKGGLLKVGDNFPLDTGKPSLPEVSAIPPCLPAEPLLEGVPESERCCPEGRDTCFIAGDIRVNEQISLTVMHTVWVREHNRVAAALAGLNPQWDDERIYQEARKIVIAQVQQITYDEFLPAILGKTFFDKLIGPYLGYQPDRDASVPTSFATSAFRFGHSLIQDAFERLGPDFSPNAQGPLPLVEAFMNPQVYFDSQGTDPFIRGWITQRARKVDEFLNSVLTTQLFETEEGMGMDLATLNIQRSRDHGIPPYPIWKKFCQNRFGPDLPEELFQFSNELTKIKFLQTYGALDTIDLWVGGLAEEPIPGGVVGPTFACIFAITFSDLRAGDRFWYENDVFTPEQLAEINQTSLARVLCDNGDDIAAVQPNAFFVNQTENPRQLCLPFLNRIRGINFNPWIEDPLCYQRVRIEPHTQDINFYFFTILSQDDVRNYQLKREGPSTSRFELCVPFECPTELRNIQISNFPSDQPDFTNFLRCEITPNTGLPADQAPPDSVYFATWTRETVQAPGGASRGLFKDLTTCQSSSTFAFTYDCSLSAAKQSSVKSNAELEDELARILQAGGRNRGSAEGTTATTATMRNISNTILPRFNLTENRRAVPDLVIDLINKFGAPAAQEVITETKKVTQASTKTDKVSQASNKQAENQANTDKLVHLLEETLEELKGN